MVFREQSSPVQVVLLPAFSVGMSVLFGGEEQCQHP